MQAARAWVATRGGVEHDDHLKGVIDRLCSHMQTENAGDNNYTEITAGGTHSCFSIAIATTCAAYARAGETGGRDTTQLVVCRIPRASIEFLEEVHTCLCQLGDAVVITSYAHGGLSPQITFSFAGAASAQREHTVFAVAEYDTIRYMVGADAYYFNDCTPSKMLIDEHRVRTAAVVAVQPN